MTDAELSSALSAVLRPVLGTAVTITDLQVLTGGASRTTWSFTAVTESADRQLILRAGAPDDVHAGMELEARVQALAAIAGAPVPQILAAEDSPAALGSPFLICNAIAGETIVRRIQRGLDDAGRAQLLRQCAAALAAIHRADPTEAGLHPQDPVLLWRERLDKIGYTTATFEWAFRWLEQRRADLPLLTPTLVHGDFRMGNLIVDVDGGTGLAAVLDWELVHSGQRYEDLAWFCVRAWRFGAPRELAAGGLGRIEEFLTAYENASDTVIDRGAFRWWLVAATLQWGVICCHQAHRHLSGQTSSVELATVGRRVCETEWDLLDLLDDHDRGNR
ncbi:MAG: phosphotransferase family protein [Mycobacterium sp.]